MQNARDKLELILKNKLPGKKIEIKYCIDKNILGGLIIKIGNKVIDGSIQNKLNEFRKHLLQ